jgi:hypothetical protein
MSAWLTRVALRLVPPNWRESVVADLEDEANGHAQRPVWLALQLAVVGLRMRVVLGFDAMMSDLRYALPSLIAAKWFTLGAVLTFALGIGVNIAVFSAVDRLLFRQLPYTDPGSIVILRSCDRMTGECFGSFPAGMSLSLQGQSATLAEIAVAGMSGNYMPHHRGASPDERLSLVNVSPRALRTLGWAGICRRRNEAWRRSPD